MQGCNLIDTSISRSEKVTKEMSPKTPKENKKITSVPYSTAFGNLMYSTMCTRLNICYVVGMVSRFQENPRMMHWKVIKRILRYLAKRHYRLFPLLLRQRIVLSGLFKCQLRR